MQTILFIHFMILSFIFGFLAAAIGVFPPGLINMTAAKISLVDGRLRALLFVLGAVIVIFFQTYIAVVFANYINTHPEIIILFREIGLIIMFFATLYFLLFAKKQKLKNPNKIKIKSKKSRFFTGMVLSAINVLPIPYYVLITVTLASYNVFSFCTTSIYSFVSGVVVGSFAVFYCYVVLFEKFKVKADYALNNMNTILGTVTGIITLLSFFNVIKYYY